MDVILNLIAAAKMARGDINQGTVTEYTSLKLSQAIIEAETWVNKVEEGRRKRADSTRNLAKDLAEIVIKGMSRAAQVREETQALIDYVEESDCTECVARDACPILERYKELKGEKMKN